MSKIFSITFIFLFLILFSSFVFAVPTGYSVNFNAGYVNDANQEVISIIISYPGYSGDTNYSYVISDEQDGNISASDQNLMGGNVSLDLNLSTLADGNLTISLTLSDENGDGDSVEDIILKDTNFPIIDFSDPYYTNETINIAPVITETGSGIASYSWSADENVTIATPDLNATDINASSEGAHTITLEVTDIAGNVQSTEFSFVWDTIAPTLVTAVLVNTDGADSNITLYFSENIETTSDENAIATIYLDNNTDNHPKSIVVDDNTVTLTFNGPYYDYIPGNNSGLQIGLGAFLDLSNNAYAGDTNIEVQDAIAPVLTGISIINRFNLYLIFSENIIWYNNKMDTLSRIKINDVHPIAASDPDLIPNNMVLLTFENSLITNIDPSLFSIDTNTFTDNDQNSENEDYINNFTKIDFDELSPDIVDDGAFPYSYVDTNINDENQLRIHITEPLYLEDGNQLQDENDLTTYYITYDVNKDNFSATYNDDENGYYIDFVTTDSNDGATIILDDINYPLFDAEENPYTPIHLQLDNRTWSFKRIVSEGDTEIIFEPDDSSYSIIIPSDINSEQSIDLNLSGILSDDNSLLVPDDGDDFYLERQTAATKYSVTIPAGTTITGEAGWNGLITLPIITTNLTVSNATTNITINVGSSYGLTFDKAVKILIGRMAGKRAAYKNGSTVTTISACTAGQIANPDSLTANTGNCYTDNGTDLIIWTKHFTDFAAYTPSSGGTGDTDGTTDEEDSASCSDIDITTTSITVYSDSTSTKSIAITNDSEDYDFEIDDITITEATGLDVSIVDEPEDIASEDSEYLKIKIEADEFNSLTTKTLELELEGVFDDDDDTDCSIDEDITVRIQLVSEEDDEEETEDADTDTNATTDLNASTRSVIDGANGADANTITYSENNLVSTTKEKKSNDWLFWLLDLSIVVVIIALVLIIKKKKDPRRSRL